MLLIIVGSIIDGTILSFNFENDKKKGKSKPGIMVDPILYQSCTTEGKLKTKISAIKHVITRTFWIYWIEWLLYVLLVFLTSLIFIKMSCPNVKQLMKPSESMVDMIVAINPVMNIPESNGGRTLYANSG